MTEVEDIPEVVADVLDTVADTAADAADISRQASGRSFGWGFGGLVVGAALGAAGGYFFAKRQLEDKLRAQADDEIAAATEEMRVHYEGKMVAAINDSHKEELKEIIRDREYATPVADEPPSAPVGVAPPAALVQKAEETRKAEVQVAEETALARNVFQEHAKHPEIWDAEKERESRDPDVPYVVHATAERFDTPYEETTLTFYEADDTLCNESDEVMGEEERAHLVGEDNLDRFGHGSADPNKVYVRNDAEEQQFEIVRSPNSYVEEVMGIRNEHPGRRRGRPRSSQDDD